MAVETLLRVVALTTQDEKMYPVRVALKEMLPLLGLLPSVPFDPLGPDDPKEATCAVGHIVSFVRQTQSPKWLDADASPAEIEKADKRCRLLQQLAATLNLDMPREAPPEPVVAAVAEVQVIEPVVKEEVADTDVVEDNDLVESLDIGRAAKTRLTGVLANLENPPKTAEQLNLFLTDTKISDLKGIGHVMFKNIKNAVEKVL